MYKYIHIYIYIYIFMSCQAGQSCAFSRNKFLRTHMAKSNEKESRIIQGAF